MSNQSINQSRTEVQYIAPDGERRRARTSGQDGHELLLDGGQLLDVGQGERTGQTRIAEPPRNEDDRQPKVREKRESFDGLGERGTEPGLCGGGDGRSGLGALVGGDVVDVSLAGHVERHVLCLLGDQLFVVRLGVVVVLPTITNTLLSST